VSLCTLPAEKDPSPQVTLDLLEHKVGAVIIAYVLVAVYLILQVRPSIPSDLVEFLHSSSNTDPCEAHWGSVQSSELEAGGLV